MEKIVFKFIKKMNKPRWVGLMFLSFLPLGLIPFVQHFFSPSPIVIQLLAGLFLPVLVYMVGIIYLGFSYTISLHKKFKHFKKLDEVDILSVKIVARTLKINPRAAYFFLEAATRGEGWEKAGNKYRSV